MKHLGLFEGIGGFSLAARWAGWQTPVMVEWNPYCQAVLKKNFPDATIFGDIRQFDGTAYAGQIDIITGVFPCQPFSTAGKRAGTDDDRYLWPEMLRVIREVAPTWVVGENVAGILSMDGGRVFAGILADLENAGYSTEVYIIPAIGVGAPHRRDRVWIVAHRDNIQRDGGRGAWNGRAEPSNENSGDTWNTKIAGKAKVGRIREGQASNSVGVDEVASYTFNHTSQRQRRNGGQILRKQEPGGCGAGHWSEHWYKVATRICGMDDGLPAGVDGIGDVPKATTKGKAHRLEALGNAIVPQIAFQIFSAINMAEDVII